MSAEITRSTYDAARSYFDAGPLRFWERHGERTVARLGLRAGARVLDVCSGTGASALAAARSVGPTGSVVGVDLSASLLERAKKKAAAAGLGNVHLRQADMTRFDDPDASFSAIVIVFGIFFAPNMEAQIRELYRLLTPGGVLAVTTWGPHLFAPLYEPFLESVRARTARRAWSEEYRPWDRLTTPDELTRLLGAAPFASVAVEAVPDREPLARPEDWWTIILGTGLRWFVDQLDPAGAERVRLESLTRARGVHAIDTSVVYATARK